MVVFGTPKFATIEFTRVAEKLFNFLIVILLSFFLFKMRPNLAKRLILELYIIQCKSSYFLKWDIEVVLSRKDD